MMKRKSISIGRLFMNLFMIAVSFTYILPLILVLSISFSTENDITQFGYSIYPRTFSTLAYKQVFLNPTRILKGYEVTIMFSLIQTVLAMLVQSLMAYALSRPNYTYRRFLSIFMFITMLFSGGLVPTYILNTQYLKLNDTIWVYILPYLISAWNIIVFRTFFQGLPGELVEAAKIDGMNEFKIYARIIIPLSTPVLASLGFINLVNKWNDWYTTLLYIRDQNLYSLQYLLQRILRDAEYVNSQASGMLAGMVSKEDMPTETMRYAMAVVAAGPMLVVFPFFQKYFARGLTVGAVKG